MSRLKGPDGLFAGRHFDRDVSILCVRWYVRYKLSLRDPVEMMTERGLSLAQQMRWSPRGVHLLAQVWCTFFNGDLVDRLTRYRKPKIPLSNEAVEFIEFLAVYLSYNAKVFNAPRARSRRNRAASVPVNCTPGCRTNCGTMRWSNGS